MKIPSVKIVIIFTIIMSLVTAGFVFGKPYLQSEKSIASPISQGPNEFNEDADFEGITEGGDQKIVDKQSEKTALLNNKEAGDPADTSRNFNILILGIDRRHGDQKNWRTDVIQLITLNEKRDKTVVTHIPRDVWSGTYKINALYNLQGPDAIKDKVQEVTGQRPDRIIRIDFDAFVWAVDSVGGLTVDVPNGFTDSGYPNDRKGIEETITVAFEEGEQTMDGETALIYARSRKGTNGEGSDYARGARQQVIMEAILDDFFRAENIFKPKTAKTLYEIATQKIYTDLSLADTEILFEILKNYGNIGVKTLGLDTSNYLMVPADRSDYGGAWTLIAKGNDYTPIHDKINQLLQADVMGISAGRE